MAKIHIISDLNLNYNEQTNAEDELIPPDCDLLVINGDVGRYLKRSLFYAETISSKYPDIPVIYNIGFNDGGVTGKDDVKNDIVSAMAARQRYSEQWPKNLHFSPLCPLTVNIGDKKYDIMCAVGYPKIHEASNWKETQWYKCVASGLTEDHSQFRPNGAADVYHGWFPMRVTIDDINRRHDQEEKIVREWELNYSENSGYKILITALSPLNDPRCAGLKYTTYPNIHLYDRLWITGGAKINAIMRGARLVSNPGSGSVARSHLIEV